MSPVPREYLGSPGDVSSGMIIPVDQAGGGSTTRLFPHILDAISQIQQFYVIEASGQPIPDDFLTIRGKLNFFNVGFGAGFLEALLFAFFMSIIMILVSDQETKQAVSRYFPLIDNSFFLWSVNLLPVIISGGLCCYLSRCYIGRITRKAVDSLLLGRVFSMVLKGLVLFFLMIWISKCINAHSSWTFARWVSFHKYPFSTRIYYILMAMKPLLVQRAFELLAIFGLAIIMPFLFIWGVAWVRKVRAARDRSLMES
jgi:hypothetical protein